MLYHTIQVALFDLLIFIGAFDFSCLIKDVFKNTFLLINLKFDIITVHFSLFRGQLSYLIITIFKGLSSHITIKDVVNHRTSYKSTIFIFDQIFMPNITPHAVFFRNICDISALIIQIFTYE